MKLKKLLAPLLIVLLLAACKTSDKLALKLNYEKGKKYYYTSTSEQTTDQTFMGQSISNTSKTVTGYIYEIVDINADGNYVVKITYDKVESSRSKETAKSPLPDDFLKGFTFDMVVTPKGKVKEIKGMDKIMDKAMAAAMPDSTNDPAAQAAMQPVLDAVKKQYNDKNMGAMMEQMTNYFPEGDVEVGDTWDNTATLNMFISMKIASTYKVTDVKDNIVKMDVDSKITTGDGPGIMGMKMSVEGTQKGTMEIDSKTGLVVKSVTNQDMEGKVDMMGMSMPMKIKSTTTVEAKEMK
ncbi:MAG: substrate-binding domain-containing protein [Sphingobacteriales bacterium JAD_PAG50586_3]|nr:MAG: substrate-binding domain-containing protein [Sphingobacteriales bacterium JAD_PAG50586_3]